MALMIITLNICDEGNDEDNGVGDGGDHYYQRHRTIQLVVV